MVVHDQDFNLLHSYSYLHFWVVPHPGTIPAKLVVILKISESVILLLHWKTKRTIYARLAGVFLFRAAAKFCLKELDQAIQIGKELLLARMGILH
jgi:hypothetical protein